MFTNGMAYLRWGTGPKTLLWIPGGPGNTVPSGMFLSRVLLRAARPLVEDGYTLWVVARKQNMPKGHAMADMAEDYAGLISDELGGKVDLVVGVSYGGVIGFHLAARHPDRFGHIALVGAAYDANERGQGPRLRLRQAAERGQARRGQCPDAQAHGPRPPGAGCRPGPGGSDGAAHVRTRPTRTSRAT